MIKSTRQHRSLTQDKMSELKEIETRHISVLLNELVESINIENAKKHIYLETYMLTEKRIQAALIKAHKK